MSQAIDWVFDSKNIQVVTSQRQKRDICIEFDSDETDEQISEKQENWSELRLWHINTY